MSVHIPIIKTCLSHPTRTLITDDRTSYRGIDLFIASSHIASTLASVSQTHTVGLLLPTSAAFPIAALGSWMLSKTIVPLNYLLKPDELQYIIDDCRCDTILTVEPMLDFLDARPEIDHLITLESIAFKTVPDLRWPAFNKPDDLACLLYTSGTSGTPKGVMLSHNNLRSNVEQILDWVDLSPNDTILGVLPQFHTFGLTVLTLLPLIASIPVVYASRFVPNRIVKLFRQHRPTLFVGIPSMYNALLSVKNASSDDFASLRFAVSGGEPLPDDVLDRFKERFGVTICEGYGLTETSPVTNWCRPNEWQRHSVGKPIPRVEQAIIDPETGEHLPAGKEGEIIINGPNRMLGYYNLPDQSARAIDAHGWFHTGDMGRFDQNGHLFITGRIKEMLIVSGENVFPREIEQVISRDPAVHDCGVVGKPDPMRGEVPVAFVELEEDNADTYDQTRVLSLCREELAGFKVPKEIHVLDALPRNATGKILRRELKAKLQ